MTGGRMRAAAATGLVCVAVLLALPAAAQPERPRVAGEAIVFILDASGSMRADDGTGRTKMEAAKEALVGLAIDLPEDLDVGLRVYGHRTSNADREAGCADTELVVPVAPLDRERIVAAASSFEPSGYTPLGLSLQEAAADLGGRAGTIILVSDGIDTCAPPDPCEVAHAVIADGVDVRIETVGFQVDEAARSQLSCIAQAGHGEYRDAADAEELGEALRAHVVRGEAVTGGASAADALLLAPGTYRDTLELGGARWYAVEPAPGQSVAVEAVLAGDPRGPYSESAVLSVEIRRDELIGDLRCDRDEVVGVGQDSPTLRVRGPVLETDGGQCARHALYLIPIELVDGRERRSRSADPIADLIYDVELTVRFMGDPIEPVVETEAPRRAVPLPPAGPPEPSPGAPLGAQLGAMALLGLLGYGTGSALARRAGP